MIAQGEATRNPGLGQGMVRALKGRYKLKSNTQLQTPKKTMNSNPSSNKEFLTIIDEITNSMKWLKKIGCKGFESSFKSINIIDSWKNINDNETLESLYIKLKDCKKCNFFKSRANISFGNGNPKSKIIFIIDTPINNDADELFTKIKDAILVHQTDWMSPSLPALPIADTPKVAPGCSC